MHPGAANTCYGVGLVTYAAEALEKGGLMPLPVEVVTGLAIPLITFGVWSGVRRMRRVITAEQGAGAK
jgi:uncharacterized membrane-anchored protein